MDRRGLDRQIEGKTWELELIDERLHPDCHQREIAEAIAHVTD